MPEKLWNRSFILFWLGEAQSTFGSSLASVALAFLVLHLTGSPSQLGITLALGILPGIVSPLAGTWVDRIALKPPLIVGDLLRGALFVLAWWMADRGSLVIWEIYLLSLISGAVSAFYWPASGILTPLLVPEGDLARANGLIGMANQGFQLVGLVVGGVVVGLLGSAPSLAVDGLTFLLMALLFLWVAIPPRHPRGQPSSYWEDLGAGFLAVGRRHFLLLLAVGGFLVNGGFIALDMLMPFVMQRLGAGPTGYGLFFGLMTGGMALGGGLIALLGRRFDDRAGVSWGIFGMSLGLFALSTAGQLWSLLPLALILGLFIALINAAISVMIQSRVEGELRGRVFGVLGAVASAGMPLSLFILSSFANAVPIGAVFAGTGLLTLVVGAAWLRWGSRSLPALATAEV